MNSQKTPSIVSILSAISSLSFGKIIKRHLGIGSSRVPQVGYRTCALRHLKETFQLYASGLLQGKSSMKNGDFMGFYGELVGLNGDLW